MIVIAALLISHVEFGFFCWIESVKYERRFIKNASMMQVCSVSVSATVVKVKRFDGKYVNKLLPLETVYWSIYSVCANRAMGLGLRIAL